MVKIESILETNGMRPKPAFVLGKTWYRHIHTHILDSTITKRGTYKKLHELLNELMRQYNPSFPFTSIQLNDNVTFWKPMPTRTTLAFLTDLHSDSLRVVD